MHVKHVGIVNIVLKMVGHVVFVNSLPKIFPKSTLYKIKC
jgi:hypothetical protein